MRARLPWQDSAFRSASASTAVDRLVVGVSGNLIFDANFRRTARLPAVAVALCTWARVAGSGGRRSALGGVGPLERHVGACLRVRAAACAPLAAARRWLARLEVK